jgi:endonuclease I
MKIKSIVCKFQPLYPLLCNKKSIEHIIPQSIFKNKNDRSIRNDLQNLSYESVLSNMKRSNIKFGDYGNDLSDNSKNSIGLSVLYMVSKYNINIDHIFSSKYIFYNWSTLNKISKNEYERQNIIYKNIGEVNEFIYSDINAITKQLDIILRNKYIK